MTRYSGSVRSIAANFVCPHPPTSTPKPYTLSPKPLNLQLQNPLCAGPPLGTPRSSVHQGSRYVQDPNRQRHPTGLQGHPDAEHTQPPGCPLLQGLFCWQQRQITAYVWLGVGSRLSLAYWCFFQLA